MDLQSDSLQVPSPGPSSAPGDIQNISPCCKDPTIWPGTDGAQVYRNTLDTLRQITSSKLHSKTPSQNKNKNSPTWRWHLSSLSLPFSMYNTANTSRSSAQNGTSYFLSVLFTLLRLQPSLPICLLKCHFKIWFEKLGVRQISKMRAKRA